MKRSSVVEKKHTLRTERCQVQGLNMYIYTLYRRLLFCCDCCCYCTISDQLHDISCLVPSRFQAGGDENSKFLSEARLSFSSFNIPSYNARQFITATDLYIARTVWHYKDFQRRICWKGSDIQVCCPYSCLSVYRHILL